MNYLALGIQIAILIVGGILLGIGLGYLADKYLGIYPWGIIVGVVLGVFLGGAGVLQVIKKEE